MVPCLSVLVRDWSGFDFFCLKDFFPFKALPTRRAPLIRGCKERKFVKTSSVSLGRGMEIPRQKDGLDLEVMDRSRVQNVAMLMASQRRWVGIEVDDAAAQG